MWVLTLKSFIVKLCYINNKVTILILTHEVDGELNLMRPICYRASHSFL